MNKEKIFNSGIAGIVNVTISEICKPTDDYREFRFKDNKGRILPHRYYYLDESDSDYEKKLKAQGIHLRHLWEVINGDVKIPVYDDPQLMLDSILNDIFISTVGRNFRIVVDYGYPPYHSNRLILKKYVPFIEEATEEKSNLNLDYKSHKEPKIV